MFVLVYIWSILHVDFWFLDDAQRDFLQILDNWDWLNKLSLWKYIYFSWREYCIERFHIVRYTYTQHQGPYSES